MNTTEKIGIQSALSLHIERYESANKAANSLKGVSAATISQIMNNNWDLIKDEMWRNIAAQVDYNPNQWIAVETRDFKTLTALLQDAQIHGNVFAAVGESGSGKSFTAKQYQNNNKRSFLLCCAEHWNRKYFLSELLSEIGRDYSGLTVSEMMAEAVRVLKQMDHPIITLDEADKLTDQVLYFFITLYNLLEGHCAIALLATNHLDKRLNKGLKLNKKGYKEIYSRLGRKCIELKGVSSTDISNICRANGIVNAADIKEIIADSEFDLRRVKRKIHAFKQLLNAA